MRVEYARDGSIRYFRSDAADREEYSYRRPFILELELTRRCNLQCVHCYADAKDRRFDDELTLEEITRVLDQAVAVGIPEVSLTGGEVLLHRNFFDVIDESLARQRNVRFVTNATMLDDGGLAELCKRPVKLITVSLDAISPGVHDEIRGPDSHARAMRNVRRLIDAGFRVSIITAFSRMNVDEFDPLLKFCVEQQLDWQVQMVSAKGRCRKDITLSPREYYELGEKVSRAYTSQIPINLIPMDDMATFSGFFPLAALSGTWQGMCTGGLLNLFIRANGDVTPCSALAFPECVVGNVRGDSLVDICKEERCKTNLAWLSAESRTGACAACRFLRECRGGCPEILLSMCAKRTENEYCYYRIEEDDILGKVLHHA
jgi:radical SAM protein with 4Fe4S-binding SPASM domain